MTMATRALLTRKFSFYSWPQTPKGHVPMMSGRLDGPPSVKRFSRRRTLPRRRLPVVFPSGGRDPRRQLHHQLVAERGRIWLVAAAQRGEAFAEAGEGDGRGGHPQLGVGRLDLRLGQPVRRVESPRRPQGPAQGAEG